MRYLLALLLTSATCFAGADITFNLVNSLHVPGAYQLKLTPTDSPRGRVMGQPIVTNTPSTGIIQLTNVASGSNYFYTVEARDSRNFVTTWTMLVSSNGTFNHEDLFYDATVSPSLTRGFLWGIVGGSKTNIGGAYYGVIPAGTGNGDVTYAQQASTSNLLYGTSFTNLAGSSNFTVSVSNSLASLIGTSSSTNLPQLRVTNSASFGGTLYGNGGGLSNLTAYRLYDPAADGGLAWDGDSGGWKTEGNITANTFYGSASGLSLPSYVLTNSGAFVDGAWGSNRIAAANTNNQDTITHRQVEAKVFSFGDSGITTNDGGAYTVRIYGESGALVVGSNAITSFDGAVFTGNGYGLTNLSASSLTGKLSPTNLAPTNALAENLVLTLSNGTNTWAASAGGSTQVVAAAIGSLTVTNTTILGGGGTFNSPIVVSNAEFTVTNGGSATYVRARTNGTLQTSGQVTVGGLLTSGNLLNGGSASAGGSGSLASGNGANASGLYAQALGRDSLAQGGESIALGANTWASGSRAISIGLTSESSGRTLNSGNSSILIGTDTTNTSFRVVKLGVGATTVLVNSNTITLLAPLSVTVGGSIHATNTLTTYSNIVQLGGATSSNYFQGVSTFDGGQIHTSNALWYAVTSSMPVNSVSTVHSNGSGEMWGIRRNGDGSFSFKQLWTIP